MKMVFPWIKYETCFLRIMTKDCAVSYTYQTITIGWVLLMVHRA